MRIKIIFLLLIGFFLSGCATQSYVSAGTGVYYGSNTHSRVAVSLNAGFSNSSSWYVYPWYSVAYAAPHYSAFGNYGGFYSGYSSYGGFYWGYNWYGGWGYYPYYQPYYGAPGYWGHQGYGRYGYNHGYNHGYRRGYNNGYNNGYRHGYYDGHYYQGPYSIAHGGNGYSPLPYRSIQPSHRYANQPVYRGNDRDNEHEAENRKKKQPVHMITRPGHIAESGYSRTRPVVYRGGVRSASGNSGHKDQKSYVVKPHQQSAVIVNSNYQPAYRGIQATETGAGYTPPHSASGYRSASGNKRYKGEAPPVRTHQIGSVDSHKQVRERPPRAARAISYRLPPTAPSKNYKQAPVQMHQQAPVQVYQQAPTAKSVHTTSKPASGQQSHSSDINRGHRSKRGHRRSGH